MIKSCTWTSGFNIHWKSFTAWYHDYKDVLSIKTLCLFYFIFCCCFLVGFVSILLNKMCVSWIFLNSWCQIRWINIQCRNWGEKSTLLSLEKHSRSQWNYFVAVILFCMRAIGFHCIQWMQSKKNDMIVCILGLVFVNTKEITIHAVTLGLLKGCQTLKAGSVSWHHLTCEPNAFCLWHLFAPSITFLGSILWAARKVHSKVRAKGVLLPCSIFFPLLKLKLKEGWTVAQFSRSICWAVENWMRWSVWLWLEMSHAAFHETERRAGHLATALIFSLLWF